MLFRSTKRQHFLMPTSGSWTSLVAQTVKLLPTVQETRVQPLGWEDLPKKEMGFSRQEYWCGLPFPSPGDLPNPGVEPGSPALQTDTLTSEPPGKPSVNFIYKIVFFEIYLFVLWQNSKSDPFKKGNKSGICEA